MTCQISDHALLMSKILSRKLSKKKKKKGKFLRILFFVVIVMYIKTVEDFFLIFLATKSFLTSSREKIKLRINRSGKLCNFALQKSLYSYLLKKEENRHAVNLILFFFLRNCYVLVNIFLSLSFMLPFFDMD